MRLGLRMILGLPQAQALRIEQSREQGPISFDRRFYAPHARVAAPIVARLARADAFGSLQLNRRASLWRALRPTSNRGALPLFENFDRQTNLIGIAADGWPPGSVCRLSHRRIVAESASDFVLSPRTGSTAIVPAAKLASMKDGRFVRVGGLVLVRQRPGTAKGITFVTIEDETGMANLIVRMDVWERFYQVARTASAFIASGRLQNQKGWCTCWLRAGKPGGDPARTANVVAGFSIKNPNFDIRKFRHSDFRFS